MDIQASPVAKGIFWLRAIPDLLRGEPFWSQGPTGIVAETLGMGWGVLAEVQDREIVIGVTRTRAAATDPQSRKKFRRYWAPMSAGIILIRYAGLPLVRKQAEQQARQADKASGRGS